MTQLYVHCCMSAGGYGTCVFACWPAWNDDRSSRSEGLLDFNKTPSTRREHADTNKPAVCAMMFHSRRQLWEVMCENSQHKCEDPYFKFKRYQVVLNFSGFIWLHSLAVDFVIMRNMKGVDLSVYKMQVTRNSWCYTWVRKGSTKNFMIIDRCVITHSHFNTVPFEFVPIIQQAKIWTLTCWHWQVAVFVCSPPSPS